MKNITKLSREELALLDILKCASAIEKDMLETDEQRLWDLPCKKCKSTKKKIWQEHEFFGDKLHIECLDCGYEFIVSLKEYIDRIMDYSVKIAKNTIR